ncbi:MAG: hypothetical protein K2Y39_09585 [Candidatus Obscuribacterales bacterium]|nr:hypothetical protein [Candidatus Obscuribacterales bacterium]
MSENELYKIEIQAASLEELREFVNSNSLDLGCRPTAQKEKDRFLAIGFATKEQIEKAQDAMRAESKVSVKFLENVSETGKTRQAEVNKNNRFEQRAVPSGLGIKE